MKRLVIVITCASLLGCQSAGLRQAATPPANTTTATHASTSEPPAPKKSFSLARVWDFVSFKRSPESQPALVPPEVLQLGAVLNAVVAKSSELNMNDPPEVTRQKAQSILDSLRPWDSMLAAGRSMGLLNDGTAQKLNMFVSQLKGEAGKLVNYAPSAETIAAVQQLAGQLQTAVGGIQGLFGDGSTVAQALTGPPARTAIHTDQLAR